MSSTTFAFDAVDIGTSVPTSKATKTGMGLFARLMEVRGQRSEATVRRFLARRSDADLTMLGFNDEQIRLIRATGKIPTTFWG